MYALLGLNELKRSSITSLKRTLTCSGTTSNDKSGRKSDTASLCQQISSFLTFTGVTDLNGDQGAFRFTWLRHQIETFSTLLALCAGNSPVTGEIPSQRQVARNFDIFFVCAWTNGWVNNRNASDLRRHRAHYDVTVMTVICLPQKF